MRSFEQIADVHGVRGQPHGVRGPFRKLVKDRDKAAPDIDGLQVDKTVCWVEIADHLRHTRQQAARNIAQVHPAQLDEGGILGQVVHVHIVEPSSEYTVPVDRKIVTLRQYECDGEGSA